MRIRNDQSIANWENFTETLHQLAPPRLKPFDISKEKAGNDEKKDARNNSYPKIQTEMLPQTMCTTYDATTQPHIPNAPFAETSQENSVCAP